MRYVSHWAVLGVVAILFTLAAISNGYAQKISPDSVKLPEMTPQLKMGKMSYDHFCASCHGVNTVGTDKGPTFLHRVYHPSHHGDGAFMIAPMRGVRAHHWPFGDMPPIDGVTEAHIKAIIEYVRAMQKANGVF